MSAHQRYLEAPYVAAADLELAYEQFLEHQDITDGEYTASELETMFEAWMEDQAEDAAEGQWERERDEQWEREDEMRF
jgi:hypothetical protein